MYPLQKLLEGAVSMGTMVVDAFETSPEVNVGKLGTIGH